MVAATIDEAVIRKTSWKSETMRSYACALVRVAIERAYTVAPYVNNDDVPDCSQPGDKTTVGAAFRMLIAAGVLRPFRTTIEASQIYGGMRPSKRPENNGHRNQLYVLTSVPIAREWLQRQGAIPPPTPVQSQMYLFN
jgi:hypothetical protein